MEIKEILEKVGYSLKDDGLYWRSKAIYRQGDNPSSLRINKTTGGFVDFPANKSGTFKDLIKLSLNISDPKELNDIFKLNLSDLKESNTSDKLKIKSKFNFEEIGTLVNNFSFYKGRGISEEVQREFGLKVCMSGKMCRRVIFPIYDRNLNVIGISGRSIFPDNDIKWKKLGMSRDWCYPIHLSEPHIKQKKEVILVESIGDVLALYNAGIKNVLNLGGIKLLKGVKQELIRLCPEKVYISTNNEPDNQFRGNDAAKQILKELSILFNVDKLEIKLPPKKDFGECSKEEIQNWYK